MLLAASTALFDGHPARVALAEIAGNPVHPHGIGEHHLTGVGAVDQDRGPDRSSALRRDDPTGTVPSGAARR